MASLAPQTGGATNSFVPGTGPYRYRTISERVTGVGSSGFLALTQTLPANSRVVMATLNNRNIITPRISSSAAQTTAGQLGIAIALGTALTTLINAGALNTTSNILLGFVQSAAAASAAANSQASGLAPVAATGGGFIRTTMFDGGIGTVGKTLWVIPYLSVTAATATGSYWVDTTATTGTTQYTLNGTGTATSGTTTADFDVQVFYETWDTPANA